MGLRRPHIWEGPSSSPVTREGSLDVPHTAWGKCPLNTGLPVPRGPRGPRTAHKYASDLGVSARPGEVVRATRRMTCGTCRYVHTDVHTQGRRLHGTCVPTCVKQPEPHSRQHRRGCYPSLSNRCPLTRLLTYALKEPEGAGNGTREHPQLRHPARTARGNPGQAERPESATVTSSQLPAPP